ncbi:MAG: hypothetical protein RLZZ283_792 [Candidatus Parcubacteria bacterium]|jgi:hypothetical protein
MKIETVPAHRLTRTAQKRIIESAQSAFGPTMTPAEVRDHIAGDVALAKSKRGKIVGFGTVISKPGEIHLGGAAVHLEHQGNGAYKGLVRARIENAIDSKTPLVTTRTQNEKVEAGIRATLLNLQDEGKIAGFSVRREKVEGVYGRKLANTPTPQPRSPYAKLDIERGDAFKLRAKIKY